MIFLASGSTVWSGVGMPDTDEAKRTERPRVLLFTDRYPVLGEDEPFLTVEVRELASRVSLILIPTTRASGPVSPLPAGVTFEGGLADYMSSTGGQVAGLLGALFHRDTYGEISAFGVRALDPRVVATVLVRGSRIFRAQRWTRRYLRAAGHVVAYSWWASTSGYGIARAANECGVPCVARIHGYELYPEQDRLGQIPFQRSGLARFDAVYSVSEAGADYLRTEYPNLAPRIHVAYLGIDPLPVQGGPSTDGTFRILSCSSCVSVKRVDLLALSVTCILREFPDLDFTWTHIGGGPTLAAVQSIVNLQPGLAERCSFTGSVSQSTVRALMANEPFDAFVNVSSSEGLPVTLMEASSNGIPMIATAIGGNPEIVNSVNGRLLEANPEPRAVASALVDVHRLPARDRDAMRAASRATWEAGFAAKANYAAFSDMLCDLWSETT